MILEKQEVLWITDGHEITICDFLRVSFQRTLRFYVGDQPDAPFRSYGASPVEKLPAKSLLEGTPLGDVILPVRNDAAFWLGITPVNEERPCALRVRIEKPEDVDAVSGLDWSETLISNPQNYIVSPPQRSLKGIRSDSNILRQFVRVGGGPEAVECHQMLLVLIPPKLIGTNRAASTARSPMILHALSIRSQGPEFEESRIESPGSAGEMIIPDKYGPDFWEQGRTVSVRVAFASDEEYSRITGKPPPGPLNPSDVYQGWRLP